MAFRAIRAADYLAGSSEADAVVDDRPDYLLLVRDEQPGDPGGL
jgi:hypothetical protein